MLRSLFYMISFMLIFNTQIKPIYLLCDIFLISQCPPYIPKHAALNLDDYCKNAESNINCFNEKLTACANFQEFQQSFETLKQIGQTTIDKVNNNNNKYFFLFY
jgi:hypothetical protein